MIEIVFYHPLRISKFWIFSFKYHFLVGVLLMWVKWKTYSQMTTSVNLFLGTGGLGWVRVKFICYWTPPRRLWISKRQFTRWKLEHSGCSISNGQSIPLLGTSLWLNYYNWDQIGQCRKKNTTSPSPLHPVTWCFTCILITHVMYFQLSWIYFHRNHFMRESIQATFNNTPKKKTC